MKYMVGLSVILENCKDISAKRKPQVVSKGSIIKPQKITTLSPPNNNNAFLSNNNNTCCCFLERCFLCQQNLLPGKDIYMYKGELGFCSVECRCRQIFMDEEELAKSASTVEYNCSLSATSSPTSPSAGAKSARNRVNNNNNNNNNAFAY